MSLLPKEIEVTLQLVETHAQKARLRREASADDGRSRPEMFAKSNATKVKYQNTGGVEIISQGVRTFCGKQIMKYICDVCCTC